MMLNDKENISSTDDLQFYFSSGRYRPQQQVEDVFLMTSLMIVLNTRSEVGPSGEPPRRIRVA
jgi:hypothetical protein